MLKDKKQKHKDFLFMLDYYQLPVMLMHLENKQSDEDFFSPHSIRNRFWQLIPYGDYHSEKARELLNSYLSSIES